jgi:hypothetical protein
MADGIAKGFVRSTEEIAGNMAMLYRLSGGSPLWQGEQGAQRLNQMNAAISNATNLQSVEDVISYSVARDMLGSGGDRKANYLKYGGKEEMYTNTYIDEMLLLERGVSADMLKGQWEAVRKLDGGNNAAMIERFKNMYGLNYTGASQVWAMMQNSNENTDWKKAEEDIKRFQETPGYRSDSSILQDLLNTVKNDGVKIGKIEFDNTELPAIREAAQEIWQLLREKEARNASPEHLPSIPAPDIPNLLSAASQAPVSAGGGPAGALQLFQGGQNYAAYMAGMPPEFIRNWETLMNYRDRGDNDFGDVIRNAVISAVNGIDSYSLSESPASIGLNSILTNFNRLKGGGGIDASEYRNDFARQLEQLTNATNALKERLETLSRDGIPTHLEGVIEVEM